MAIVASSTKSFNGSGLGELGIACSVKNGINFSLTKISLNVLEKGPIYEINAEAIKTSPTITSISAYLSSIICPHLPFSEPRALSKREAKSSLSE